MTNSYSHTEYPSNPRRPELDFCAAFPIPNWTEEPHDPLMPSGHEDKAFEPQTLEVDLSLLPSSATSCGPLVHKHTRDEIMAGPPNIASLPLETVLRICRVISSDGGPGSAISRDLTAIALTCRSLNEPALDTLWHSIRSLAPLLRTLPEDLCIVAPFFYNSGDGRIPRAGSQLVSTTLLLAHMKSH